MRSSGLRLTPELLPSRESRPKASPLLSSSLVRERERLQKRRRKVKRRKGGVAAGERKTEGAPWRGRMGGSSPRTRSRCSATPLPSSSTFLGNFTFYRRNRLAPKKKNPTYSVAFSFKILFAIYILVVFTHPRNNPSQIHFFRCYEFNTRGANPQRRLIHWSSPLLRLWLVLKQLVFISSRGQATVSCKWADYVVVSLVIMMLPRPKACLSYPVMVKLFVYLFNNYGTIVLWWWGRPSRHTHTHNHWKLSQCKSSDCYFFQASTWQKNITRNEITNLFIPQRPYRHATMLQLCTYIE